MPLEDGEVRISRAAGSVRLPARFLLIAAMNPCPAAGTAIPTGSAAARPQRLAAYRARISGPLLDRFDLQVDVPRVEAHGAGGEPTAAVALRVGLARQLLAERRPALGDEAQALLRQAADRRFLSGRGAARAHRVARTIAALGREPTRSPTTWRRRCPTAPVRLGDRAQADRPRRAGYPGRLSDLHDPPRRLSRWDRPARRWPGSGRRWRSSARAGRPRPACGWRASSPAQRRPRARWWSAAWRSASTRQRTRARSAAGARRWPCSAAAPTSPTRARTADSTRDIASGRPGRLGVSRPAPSRRRGASRPATGSSPRWPTPWWWSRRGRAAVR